MSLWMGETKIHELYKQLVVYTFLYTLFFSIHGKKADVTMDGRS